MATGKAGLRAAIVGATSLKGRELKEVLGQRALGLSKLTLLDDPETRGTLTEFDGEPAVVNAVAEDTFTEHDIVFFASTSGYTRACWPQAKDGSAAVVDLTHALLDFPEAVLSFPHGQQAPPAGERWYVVPHPAALTLMTLMSRLESAFGLRQAAANIFEPVSRLDAAGVDELQQQTVNLLSFKDFPQEVFDSQVAFNLLPRVGAEARTPLEEVEDNIQRALGRCVPELTERLALRVVQAPVFHGQCISLLVELEKPVEIAAVEEVLRSNGVEIPKEDDPPVTVVKVVGREDILVDRVKRDRNRPACFWIWAAADNLRLQAGAAADIVEKILGQRKRNVAQE